MGFYADQNDCSRFCYCAGSVNELSQHSQCQDGLIWNQQKVACDYPDFTDTSGCVLHDITTSVPDSTTADSGSGASTTTVDPSLAGTFVCGADPCGANFCAVFCDLPMGFYADINDNSRYCYCSGSASELSQHTKCPAGLLWNQAATACDYAYNL